MEVTKKLISHLRFCHEVEEKDVVLGLRSPKKRSLLSVNEHFEGELNDKIHFLFSRFKLIVISHRLEISLLVFA